MGFLSKTQSKGKDRVKGDGQSSNSLSGNLSKSLVGSHRRKSFFTSKGVSLLDEQNGNRQVRSKSLHGSMFLSKSFEDAIRSQKHRLSAAETVDELDSTSSTFLEGAGLTRRRDTKEQFGSSTGTYPRSGRKSCLKKHYSTCDLEKARDQSNRSTLVAPPKRSVSFDVVEVREYAPSISHNPTVKDGIAVELGWEVKSSMKMQFEDFESTRPPPVKSELDLLLTQEDRLRMLRVGGHSPSAIQKAMDASRKGRNYRMQTLRKIRAEDRKMEGKMKKLNLAKLSDLEMEGNQR